MNKILRSVLFTPAGLRKSFDKSLLGPADCVIFDLEDSVHPDKKVAARSILVDYFNSSFNLQNRKTIAIRINCPFSSPWGLDDFDAIKSLKVNAIVIPKVQDISAINSLYTNQNVPTPIPLWAMIETAKGVLNAETIASSELVEALVFGSNDLTKDLKSKHVLSRQPLLFSMSKVILAARAYSKYVIDGVHLDIHDLEGLKETCIQGRNLGFDGKSLIHPNQVEVTNQCFSPSDEEIQLAKKVVSAYEAAAKNGQSMCVVDGKLVEELHVDQARAVLLMESLIKST